MRDEELFPKKRVGSGAGGLGAGGASASGGMTRSSSGLSITSAMGLTAARKKYDSVIVSRRKNSVDEVSMLTHHANAEAETGSASLMKSSSGTPLTSRAKNLASRKYKKQPPTILASNLAKVESGAEVDIPLSQSPATPAESPFPASHASSTSSSNPASALPSPLEASLPLPVPDASGANAAAQRQSDVIIVPQGEVEEQYKPKRTRSMVDNVRSFFHSRPASPSPSSASDTASVAPVHRSSPSTTPSTGTEQEQSDAPPAASCIGGERDRYAGECKALLKYLAMNLRPPQQGNQPQPRKVVTLPRAQIFRQKSTWTGVVPLFLD